jgi:FkbH-like protein
VPELPADPSLYPWTLAAAGYFEAVYFSGEDRQRAHSYAANSERAKMQAAAGGLGDYLAALDMAISFAPFDARGRARIAQLINKSNQFNLTTRRYTEREIAVLETDASAHALQVRLRDRFGDFGMIAVAICRTTSEPGQWELDTWLMSCRVLERRVEECMLQEIVTAAREHGIGRLIGVYKPTAKNGVVAEHYAKLGFSPLGQGSGGEWRYIYEVASHTPGDLPLRVERPASGGALDPHE